MARIVQKFGGSSVATPERIRRVAARVAETKRAGNELVVVVSAMGDATDELVALAGAVAREPRRRYPRELDVLLTAGERIAMALLAMAVQEEGEAAISFTGSQAAIITDAVHTGARIEEVRADRVRDELARGRVVIVAGFQGVSREREVTTLGRGGSDTTAVALAAVLGAERCDIHTDVDGVYTADPRRVPGARRITRLAYDEMLELAHSGARVLHPRAVEMGARYSVPIRVLSSTDAHDGATMITQSERGMERLALTGLASDSGHVRLALAELPADMRMLSRLLSRLAGAGVSVDMVALADRPGGCRQLQLSIRAEELGEARSICDALLADVDGGALEVRDGLARIALVGSGMHDRPGVYARAFEVLLEAGIEVYGISTSSISISLLIDEGSEEAALRQLHDAFGLEKEA